MKKRGSSIIGTINLFYVSHPYIHSWHTDCHSLTKNMFNFLSKKKNTTRNYVKKKDTSGP